MSRDLPPDLDGLEGDDLEHALALVGASGRFPGAADVDALWRNLIAGVESIERADLATMRAAGVDPARLADPRYVAADAPLAEVERFDAAYFAIPPRDAEVMDPQLRLFLECAVEALEAAGCVPAAAGAVGVFAGASLSTYLLRRIVPARGFSTSQEGLLALIGTEKDYLPTFVAYKLGLTGPCLGVQTACSSSLVAVHLACQSLLAHECDVALAGGATVKVPQREGYVAEEGSYLARDGRCRAFDAEASGAVFGSGVGVVVLRRLADALADGDPVIAVIRGSAVNNDGANKVGFTAPSPDGQAAVIREALAIAGVDPASIGYVEAHGTGTALGDPIEIAGLAQVFGGLPARSCGLGSVKTNVGHLECAAGVTGLLKAALAVQRGELPPSLHFRSPGPHLGIERTPFFVCAERQPWPARRGPRRAGVSSFGMGGTNAHVVLEAPPPRAEPPREASTAWLLPVSARSEAALDEALRRLADHLDPPASLSSTESLSLRTSSLSTTENLSLRTSSLSTTENLSLRTSSLSTTESLSLRTSSLSPSASSEDLSFQTSSLSPPEGPTPADLGSSSRGAAEDLSFRTSSPAPAGSPASPRDTTESPASPHPADLVYTAAVRRAHHPFRAAVVGRDLPELAARLRALAADGSALLAHRDRAADPPPRVGLVFSPHGAQWAGMGRDLLALPPFHDAVRRAADALLRAGLGFDVVDRLRAADPDQPAWLDAVDLLQPVLFALQLGLHALLVGWGLEVAAIVGHSAGEAAAAVASGALTLDDGARVVVERTRLLRGLRGAGGAMAMVELPRAEALELLRERPSLHIAAANGPRSLVLAGDEEALEALVDELLGRGIFCGWGVADVASHGPAMRDASSALGQRLADLSPSPSTIPYYGASVGARVDGSALGGRYWAAHLRDEVRFWDAAAAMARDGVDLWVEVGPHPLLLAPLQDGLAALDDGPAARDDLVGPSRDLPSPTAPRAGLAGASPPRCLPTLRRGEGLSALLDLLGALHVRGAWSGWGRLYPRGQVVPLPAYPWQRRRFWVDDPPRASVGGGHPLLGVGAPLAAPRGAFLWQQTLTRARLGPLAEHAVDGATLVPGAAIAEAMLAAAAEVWKDRLEGTGPKGQVPRDRSCAPRSGVGGLMDPTDPPSAGPRSAVMDPADPPGAGPRSRVMGPANDGGAGSGGASEASTSAGPPDGERLVPVVEGLSIEVALTLAADEARALQTVALPEGDGLQVVLASRDGEGAWVEHARARVRTGAAPRGRSEAPARVRARCPRRRDGDEHRAALRARGIELGAAFAGIVALWSGPGEVLAEIRAPASIARALPLSLAHPALLDACVQTFGAAAAGDDDDGAAWLPVGFGALACAPDLAERAAEGPLWCHTRVRARTSGSLEGSLALVDADGRPLLTLDGFVARRADPGALAGEQDTYALRWTPRPVPTPASAAGAWLVAGAGPLAGAIADALASAGGRCVQVSAAPDARAEALLDAPIRGVLLVAEEGPVADAASAAPTRPADPGPADALAWAQRLAGRGARDVPRLWIVTCGAQATRAGEGASPGLAALWGLARALRHELPELRCAAVDLPAARDPASDPFGRAISGDEPLADPLDPAAASLRYATSGEEPLADPLDPAAASLRRAISSEDPLADPPDPDLPIAALVGLLTGDDPEDEWALRGGEGLVPRLIPWSRRGSGRWRARGDGTYLVTGGLGGLGGATAAWLVERGARHLALVGRSAPGPAADAVIADLRRQGAQVEVLRVDVADPEAWSRAAAGLARSAPPVVGVVHGAGVLDDGVALQQDAARMARVLRPKLDGGEALDRWAAGAELFVAFGSTAGLLGELAQAPYAAANAALTALAHRRRRAGRHALTVDWGPWAEVGRAAGGAGGRGYRPMTPARALQALEALLVDDATHAVVASLDLRQWREVHLPVASTPLLADLEAAPPPGRRADVDAQRAALAALAPGPRRARVVHGVQAEVGAVLRLDAAEIDPRSPLRDLGVDSLRTMELRNRLEARFGVLLTAASLWSHGQVEALAGLVLTRLGLAEAPVAATPGATASTGARHDAATPRDRQGAASDPRLAAAPGDRHADAMPDAAPFGVPGTAASRHDGAAPPGAAPPGAATPGATASTGARHDAATPRDRQGAASDPRLAAAPGDRLAAAMPGATPFGVPGTAADAAAAAPGDRHAATSDPRLAAAASDLSGTAAARPDDAAPPGAAAHPGDGPLEGLSDEALAAALRAELDALRGGPR